MLSIISPTRLFDTAKCSGMFIRCYYELPLRWPSIPLTEAWLYVQ